VNATSTSVGSSTNIYNGPAFWERLWRTSGIGFVAFALVAYALYVTHTHVMLAAVISGMAVLNLLWFAAALRTTLADAGRDGWGAAVTTSSTAVGVMFFVLIALVAALERTSGLSGLAWPTVVLSSFPRAMLIMSGSFGLWRAGLFSNAQFGVGVAALVLVLLGGTTWMDDGFWSSAGAYSRFVSPLIGVLWILGASRVLVKSPATRTGW